MYFTLLLLNTYFNILLFYCTVTLLYCYLINLLIYGTQSINIDFFINFTLLRGCTPKLFRAVPGIVEERLVVEGCGVGLVDNDDEVGGDRPVELLHRVQLDVDGTRSCLHPDTDPSI